MHDLRLLRYLLAVVGGVLHAHQVCVWPSIEVSVLAANVSVSSIAWSALAAEHSLGVDAQVDAVCVFVAVVATVLARVAGFANLKVYVNTPFRKWTQPANSPK